MRILVTANPMYGHVNVVLPFALAAQRAGHEVAVATGLDLVDHVERRGIVGWPVGPTHREAGGGPDADWLEYFAVSAAKRAVDLVPRVLRWRPDLIVSDDTELAAPVAAAVADARHVVHGIAIMPQPRIWEAFRLMLQRLYDQWHVSASPDAIRDRTYLEVCPPSLRETGERLWPTSMSIRPAVGEPNPGEELPTLDGMPHADTVHLTLGTVFHHNRGALTTALAGLRDLPVNVVVTTGPGVDPAELGPQPANVLVRSYLPHSLLLPKCRILVAQGGAGGMFGALAHGLPQLVLPQGAEQFINAEACHRAGAALVLRPDEITPGAVATAVRRLLDEERFTAAARAVQAEIAAMPDAATVLATLTSD